MWAAGELGPTVHTPAEPGRPTHYLQCHAIDHIASRHLMRPIEIVAGAPLSAHDADVVELKFPGHDTGSAATNAR